MLHEMLTGKRAFENSSERIAPTNVSSLAKDIDPLVKRVILRYIRTPEARQQQHLRRFGYTMSARINQ